MLSSTSLTFLGRPRPLFAGFELCTKAGATPSLMKSPLELAPGLFSTSFVFLGLPLPLFTTEVSAAGGRLAGSFRVFSEVACVIEEPFHASGDNLRGVLGLGHTLRRYLRRDISARLASVYWLAYFPQRNTFGSRVGLDL